MLAIIIPYYKIDFFEITLSSLVNQTDKRFTAYIGNDNSTKDPSLLLEKYANEFNFIYQKYDTNLGSVSLVKQWERCIALSKNEKWIMILGDDDVLGANVVEEFYNNYNIFDKQVNVVRFSTYKIDAFENLTSDKIVNPELESSIDFFFRKTSSSLSEYIFRKEQVINIGFKRFPMAWCSDILAVLELSDFKNIYSINVAVVYVRISNKSISGSSKLMKEKNLAAFRFLYYLLTKKRNFFDSSQQHNLQGQIVRLYLNNKKKISFFLLISFYFLRFFLIFQYFSFLQNIFFSINKKSNYAGH